MDSFLDLFALISIDSITPYISDVMKNKITQEVIAWGIIYTFVVKKDLVKGFKRMREEFKDELNLIKKSIDNVSETIIRVEENHGAAVKITNERLGRLSLKQDEIRKEFTNMDDRVKFLEEFIKGGRFILKRRQSND